MAQVEQIITNRYLVVEKLRDLLTARFGTDYNVTVRTLSQPSPSFSKMLPPALRKSVWVRRTGRGVPSPTAM
jgi:hypothetical protein